jgi:hypothetical protein
MVFGMPDMHQDPSGDTAAFRAFAHPDAEPPAAAKPSPNLPLIIAVAVVVAIVLGLIGWLALR